MKQIYFMIHNEYGKFVQFHLFTSLLFHNLLIILFFQFYLFTNLLFYN